MGHGFCSPQKLLCTPGRSPGFEVAPVFLCLVPPSPAFRRVDVWDRSSFTVAGPHRDCTGLPFSALAGTLGLQQLYHARPLRLSVRLATGRGSARAAPVRSTSRRGPRACSKALAASPRRRVGISRANPQERLAALHRWWAESRKTLW